MHDDKLPIGKPNPVGAPEADSGGQPASTGETFVKPQIAGAKSDSVMDNTPT